MSGAALNSIHVLHVDDEPDFSELASQFVERADERFSVETASNAAEALDRLRQAEFDCIVSDFDMPGKNGIDFLETVREEYPYLPFILYTGKGSEEVASEAISAGVTDYIQKESGTSQYTVLANRISNSVERFRSSQIVEETEQKLSQLAEKTDDILFMFDSDWTELLYINSAYEEVWDRSIAELEQNPRSFLENVHPEDQDLVEQTLERILAGEPTEVEHRLLTDEDEVRWIYSEAQPIFNDEGTFTRIVGFVRDITERKEEERKREQIIERVTDAIVEVDADWQFTLVNEQAEELYDKSEESLLGRDFWEVFEEAKGTRFEEEYRRVMETREPTSFTEYFSQLEGWFDIKVYPRDDGGLEFYFVEVTEQKEREQRYKAIFNQTYQFTGLLEPDGTLIEANETALEFGELDRDEVIGKKMWDAYWFQHSEATRERAKEAVQRAANGEFVRHELPIQGAGGGVIIDFSVRPITNERGEVTSIVPEGRDITELKEREQELQKRTNQLQDIIDTVEAALWIRNNDSEYEYMNQYHRDLFDIADDVDIAGKQPTEMLPAAVAEQFHQNDQRVYETGEPVEIEETVETEDGPRNFLTRIVPLFEDGSVYATCGIATDITERVKREQALEESEERYRKLLATAPTPILIYSQSEEIIYANDEAVELFGAETEEEVLGLTPHDFGAFDSQADLDDRRRRLVEEKQAVPPNELTILDRDGREKTVLVASSPITYEGEPAIQTVATDITELKDRERQLERYETLVEVSGDPMYMMDTEGHLEYVNEAFVERVGYEEDELLGEHLSKVMVDNHVERGEELIQSLLRSGDSRGTFEMEAISKSGDRIPAEAHISLLYRDGDFSGSVGVLRDITDRLERERQLQRERDRLDEFASVVSHDLRNPMSVAQGRLELAKEGYESEDLAAVELALNRMERLIEDVLSMARVGESVGETEQVQLSNLVEACWRNVDTDAAELNVETEATILADKTRLQQLLENLIRNAVEHGGSDITITVGDVPDGFFVEDDGPGIPEDERDKVLNPGYSTLEEGTGFGLSIVRDIVQAHDWQISVSESSNGGTRFEITGV